MLHLGTAMVRVFELTFQQHFGLANEQYLGRLSHKQLGGISIYALLLKH
jgi:hypothetical protein